MKPTRSNHLVHTLILLAWLAAKVVAGPITDPALAVSSSLFAVTPNFGGNMFDGNALWLPIAPRTNGAGTFTTRLPRPQILPMPFALRASLSVTG